MSLPSDAQIAAEDAAKVAVLVKKLHERPHTSFLGAQAEGEREDAASTLGEMKAYVAIPDLMQALDDPNHDVRANAAHSLWLMADHAAAAEPALRKALKDNWTDVNLYAASALWDMKVGGKEMVPVLHELCISRDGYSAARAADLGTLILNDPTEFIPCFMRSILDAKQDRHVVTTIHDGTQYLAYLPVIMQGTRSADAEVRSGSANLLGVKLYAGVEVTATLRKMATQDLSEVVRLNAVQSLVYGGEGREVGVPVGTAEGTGGETIALLVSLLQGHDWPVQAMAASALACAKTTDANAVTALIAALSDPQNDVQVAAARALGAIGNPGAAAAKPALWAILNTHRNAVAAKANVSSEDEELVRATWYALDSLGEKPPGSPSD